MNNSLVRLIDPAAECKCRLRPASLYVYRVEKNGVPYVLKAASLKKRWECKHLMREQEILQRVKDLPHITHLVQDYGVKDWYLAILKEYAPGNCLPKKHSLKDPMLQHRLQKTVKELHQRGIARLDLYPENIVLSLDGRDFTLIDIGLGIFRENVNGYLFRKAQMHDLHDMFQLFC